MITLRRALLSVSDKTGLVPFARALEARDVELIATGGTRRALEEAGIATTAIDAITGNPEAFGGRMKTISFTLASGLLFDRSRDADEARSLGIEAIDLVVCNLYPFEAVRDAGGDLDRLIEHIDIGGPTMIRAAAKNHRWVAVATDPDDYPLILAELAENAGALTPETRARLARRAFHRTADYDAAIATTLDARHGVTSLHLAFDQGQPLRYGENSHQRATLLRERGAETSLADLELLGGKALSFNNLTDAQAALDAVKDLDTPACAVIKHQNPCGLATGEGDVATILAAAWEGDPLSAFGSVIATNRPLSAAAARFFALDAKRRRDRKFIEAILAPAFDDDALAYLRQHASLRIIRFDPRDAARARDIRLLTGAALVQDTDDALWADLEVKTKGPDAFEVDEALLTLGVIAARQVKSNAIVIVRRRSDGVMQLLGMGAGQPNRVEATRLALARARENLARGGDDAHVAAELGRAYLVSDAFFPFPDSVEIAADAGIRRIFQPGGSIRDKAVVTRCDALGVAMVFMGTRHFKH